MMPPTCCLCDEDFDPGDGGILVEFELRPSDREWSERMRTTGAVGHPPQAKWFCKEHGDAARELSGETVDVAMKKLRASFEAS